MRRAANEAVPAIHPVAAAAATARCAPTRGPTGAVRSAAAAPLATIAA